MGFRCPGVSKSAESAIQASKIAGHSELGMTAEYPFVTPERQNELPRRIQETLTEASKPNETEIPAPPVPGAPDVPPNLADAKPATTVLQ